VIRSALGAIEKPRSRFAEDRAHHPRRGGRMRRREFTSSGSCAVRPHVREGTHVELRAWLSR
jgi:hypothetical protein